jgi:hypothetical protein
MIEEVSGQKRVFPRRSAFFLPGQRTRDAAGRRRAVRVFLSYAHRDERLREELDKHLSPLRRSALIEIWHDRRISPGAELDTEIDQHLGAADLVLLLISPDFINSDYCYRREMRLALRRHAKGQARVIPIILRPVDWGRTPIGRLLATPRDAKPVTTWHRRDDALLDVATSVRRAAEEITTQRTATAPKPTAASTTNRLAVKERVALRRDSAANRRSV